MNQRQLIVAILSTLSLTSRGDSQSVRRATVGLTLPASNPSYAFTHIEGIVQLSDGSLLVLQPEDRWLLHFSLRGEFLGQVGRDGEGPGEFRWPLKMGSHGNGIWIWDAQLRRIALFDKALQIDTTLRLPQFGPASLLENGSVLLQEIDPPKPPQMRQSPRETRLTLIEKNGNRRLLTSWLVDPSVLTLRLEGGVIFTGRQPFSEAPLWAVAPGGTAIAIVRHPTASALGSLVVLSPMGDTIGRVPLPWRSIPVTDRMFKIAVDSVIRSIESSRPPSLADRRIDPSVVEGAIQRPKRISTVTEVLVGADGLVWVRRPASDPGWSEWNGFASNGQPSAGVFLPADARVLLFTAKYAWTVRDGDQGPTITQFLLPRR